MPGAATVLVQPLFQHWLEVGQLEKVVLRFPFHRCGAGDDRHCVFQVGWRIGGAADFTTVAVLVNGTATRTGAANEAIRQEHFLDRVIGLLDRALADMALLAKAGINSLGKPAVFVRMGAVIIIEANVETGKVGLVFLVHARDQLLRRDPVGLGPQHDRGAMCIVGTYIIGKVAAHTLEPDPDVGLDVFHQVPQVDRAVGIGQGAGNQDFASGIGHVGLMNRSTETVQ